MRTLFPLLITLILLSGCSTLNEFTTERSCERGHILDCAEAIVDDLGDLAQQAGRTSRDVGRAYRDARQQLPRGECAAIMNNGRGIDIVSARVERNGSAVVDRAAPDQYLFIPVRIPGGADEIDYDLAVKVTPVGGRTVIDNLYLPGVSPERDAQSGCLLYFVTNDEEGARFYWPGSPDRRPRRGR